MGRIGCKPSERSMRRGNGEQQNPDLQVNRKVTGMLYCDLGMACGFEFTGGVHRSGSACLKRDLILEGRHSFALVEAPLLKMGEAIWRQRLLPNNSPDCRRLAVMGMQFWCSLLRLDGNDPSQRAEELHLMEPLDRPKA
ncbi:hypothetical protein NDU88_002042 [Pleurodeles waltl]|uniref:Uncharacterized protein n=1 Tax=Pleurodeles waltl TaxID=8319 RepID=A0AAV7UVT8_PLEWA|nr:hypothetical protein NDU88_002042 [Pleurodeles waltl]